MPYNHCHILENDVFDDSIDNQPFDGVLERYWSEESAWELSDLNNDFYNYEVPDEVNYGYSIRCIEDVEIIYEIKRLIMKFLSFLAILMFSFIGNITNANEFTCNNSKN